MVQRQGHRPEIRATYLALIDCAQRSVYVENNQMVTEQVNAIPNWIHHRGNVIELSPDGIV